MHELSIAISLLDLAAEEAQRRQVRVAAIHLKLGPLAGVVKEALLSAFELARENSDMPEARLVIEETPIVAFCPVCASEQPIASMQEMRCPVCRTPTPQIITGRELEVSALEVWD